MALKLGYQTLSWFWWPEEFTVFQMLEEIRLSGFTAVEFNDDLKRLGSPEEIQRNLETLNMEATGFCSAEHMIAVKQQITDWKNRIAFAGKLGVKALALPLGWRQTGEAINDAAYRTLAKNLDELNGEAAKYDMALAYTPRYATLVENERDLERLLPYAKDLKLCADMVNIAVSGGDPVAYIKKYADRIVYARIGDWRIHKTVPLGTGYPLRQHETWSGVASTEVQGASPVVPSLDVPRFMAALEEINYDGYVVVSQGTTDPESTPIAAAEISRHYLRKIGY